MRKFYVIVIVLHFVCLQSVFSQITTNELPVSVQRGINLFPKDETKGTVVLPLPDINKVLREDSLYQEKYPDGIQRTSIPIQLICNIMDDGKWKSLEDGGKIWQVRIHVEKALALDFVFSKFWLPKGGKFFIFNPSTKETIGAITSQYLLGEKNNPHRLSTGIVKGNEVVLEYYQPVGEHELPVVTIEKVYYSYIEVPNFNKCCPNEVNVNCSEGSNWQFEKDAVALVYCKFNQGGKWCSGSLVNNTLNNQTPYFLTANHCLVGDFTLDGGYIETKDAISDNNLSDWVFYWGYELANCSGNTQPNYYSKTTTGAIVKANNSYADFALLQLQQDPRDLSNYVPYYLGWDASGSSGTGGVCIHHPLDDVKKISTYSCTPQTVSFNSSPYVYWGVQWIQTENGHGITENGSSGSPLINNNHLVIGQLKGQGENLNCSNYSGISKYGKISVSWTGNNNNDYRRRLDCWLNPNGTNTLYMNGLSPLSISGSLLVCSTESYMIQNLPSGATVQWSTSNSKLSLVSGQGTSTATFQKVSNGACLITAIVSFGTSTLTLTKNVWAGTPTAPTVTGWPHTNLFMENTEYDFVAHGNSQAQILEYQWTVIKGATLISGGNSSNATFLMNSPGPVSIRVRARNACGWGPYTNKSGSITDDNGLIPINSPGNNIVSIPLSGDGEYEIQLWNTNRMIRSTKTTKSSYDVDLSNLPSDLYIIKVLKDGQNFNQMKVKKQNR